MSRSSMSRSSMFVLLVQVLSALNLQFFLFDSAIIQVHALTVRIPGAEGGYGKSLLPKRFASTPISSYGGKLTRMKTLSSPFLYTSSSLFSTTRRQFVPSRQRPYLSSSSSYCAPYYMMMNPNHINDIFSFNNNVQNYNHNYINMNMNMMNDFNNQLLSFASSLSPIFSSSKPSLLLSFLSGSGIAASIVGFVYHFTLMQSIQDFQSLDQSTKRHLFMAQDASKIGIIQTLGRVKRMKEKEEKKEMRQHFLLKTMMEEEDNNNKSDEILDQREILENKNEGKIGMGKDEENKNMNSLKQDNGDGNLFDKMGHFLESFSRNVTGGFDFESSNNSSNTSSSMKSSMKSSMNTSMNTSIDASINSTSSLSVGDKKEELMLQLQLLEEENSLLAKFINSTMSYDDDDGNGDDDDDDDDDDDHYEQGNDEIDYDYSLQEDLKSLSQEELEQQIKQLQQDIFELNQKRGKKLEGTNNVTQEILSDVTSELKNIDYDNMIASVTNTSVVEELLNVVEEAEGKEISKPVSISLLANKTESQTEINNDRIQMEKNYDFDISGKDISNDNGDEEKKKKEIKDGESTLDRFEFIEEQLVAKKGLTISKQLNDLGISKTSNNLTSIISQNVNDKTLILQKEKDLNIGLSDTTKALVDNVEILNMNALSSEERNEDKHEPSSQASESLDNPVLKIKSSKKESVANPKEYKGDDNDFFSSKDRELYTSEKLDNNDVEPSEEFETSVSNVNEAHDEEPKKSSLLNNQNEIFPSLPNTEVVDVALEEKVENAKEAIAEAIRGTHYEQKSPKEKDTQRGNKEVGLPVGGKPNPDEDSVEFLVSEREKRQKAMAQDLATAAFHEELQRNKRKNKDDEIRTQYYKNQIENDMARVRKYAAQKKLRKEVKQASDMHSNSNLLSMLSNEKKIPAMKDKVSLRRQVQSSTSLKSTTFAAGGGEASKDIKKDITMWDIVNKESGIKQGNRMTLPLRKKESNDRGILLLGKSKRFKTPKRTSDSYDKSLSSENKENRAFEFNSFLGKRSLAIALALVVAKRISQLILL